MWRMSNVIAGVSSPGHVFPPFSANSTSICSLVHGWTSFSRQIDKIPFPCRDFPSGLPHMSCNTIFLVGSSTRHIVNRSGGSCGQTRPTVLLSGTYTLIRGFLVLPLIMPEKKLLSKFWALPRMMLTAPPQPGRCGDVHRSSTHDRLHIEERAVFAILLVCIHHSGLI